jgi:hypothetical protein
MTKLAVLFSIAPFLLAPIPAVALCPCDCDGNGSVHVAELVRAVNIALGQSPISECEAVPDDGGTTVEIDNLVRCVRAALEGCPPPGPPSPTPTTFICRVTPTPCPSPQVIVFPPDSCSICANPSPTPLSL